MRVLNKKYWPYQITLDKRVRYITDSDPRERWCYENFKSANWNCLGYDPKTFAFKRQEDAVLFALKWS